MNVAMVSTRSVLLIGTLVSTAASFAEENVDTLVDGMIRRRAAIQTATVQYKYGSLWAYPGEPRPWGWDPKDCRETILTIAGNEWASYQPNDTRKTVHRNSHDASYYYTPQPNGTTIHSLSVNGSEDSLESQQDEDQRFQVVQAGVIPWSTMMDYFDRNRKKAACKGKVPVEGENAYLLEWTVPKKDFAILHAYHPVLSSEYEAALLMVYVVPDRGYVIRRLDYCTPGGQMVNRFEANHFKEIAKGIYFPWEYYYVRNFFDYGNRQGYYADRFSVLKITDVNQPIPASILDIEVPLGTYVGDHRPGKPEIYFRTGQTVSLSSIDDAIANHVASQRPVSNRKATLRAVLVLGNIGLITILAIAILVRQWKASRAA